VPLPTALRLTVAVTLDDTPIAGFPVERRRTGDQLVTNFFTRAADGLGTVNYVTPPILLPIDTVLLETEQPVLVSLNAQDPDAVSLGHHGALLVLGADLQQLHLANPSDTPAPCSMVTLV
jgi:hypothetical protein